MTAINSASATLNFQEGTLARSATFNVDPYLLSVNKEGDRIQFTLDGKIPAPIPFLMGGKGAEIPDRETPNRVGQVTLTPIEGFKLVANYSTLSFENLAPQTDTFRTYRMEGTNSAVEGFIRNYQAVATFNQDGNGGKGKWEFSPLNEKAQNIFIKI